MSIATINRCINFRNRHNNGPDRLMPRAIFVQQHGLAKSKSDISDSILLSFACNSQPFTFFVLWQTGSNKSTFQHNWIKKHLSFFFWGREERAQWESVSQMLLTHYVDGIAFLLLIGCFQMLQQIWYVISILSTSSLRLYGSSSLGARNYLRKSSTSYFNASSEVTKEELHQFFSLGNN